MRNQASGLRWLWVMVIVFLLDRVTKYIALMYLPPYAPVSVVPHFNLTLAYNRGAAFSFLGSASGWQMWVLGGIAIAVTIGILVWLYRLTYNQRWLSIALSMIMGGAIGNLYDRIAYEHVIDFIQLYAGEWYWPAFNIADSAICVGATMLFIEAVFFKKQ